MTGRVIVVGSVNVDLVARVDHLPSAGETVTGATFERHSGGKGANQATAAARLGAAVTFVGAVGGDPLADEARAALATEGVNVREMASLPGPTGVALILVDDAGENLIAVASGANAGLTVDDVSAALDRIAPSPVDVVVVSHEIPTATTIAALRAGRQSGATTILNPAPATGLGRAALESVDILVPNRGELADLLMADDHRTGRVVDRDRDADVVGGALTLLEPSSEGPGVRGSIVVTLGSAGALIVRRGASPLAVGAPRVEAIDTVGAGDTFVGALAADLAAGSRLDDAVGRAVVAAALSTTRAGARGGMPTAAELSAELARLARTT